MRKCGSCGLCCKLLGIKELNKPMRQWCPHFEDGKGCTIYAMRPEECRTFNCLWLTNWLPRKLKPNRCGVVASLTQEYGLMLNEDEHADAEVSFRDQLATWRKSDSDLAIIAW